MTYNLTTKRLQGRSLKNPEQSWTRFSAFEPIISVEQYRKAQERLSQSAPRRWNREEIIQSLQSVVAQNGRLTQVLINHTEGAPATATIIRCFGSLTAAYTAIGYKPPPRLSLRAKYWTNKRVLSGLRRLYNVRGYVSNRLIDDFPSLPSYHYIRRHFGSLQEVLKQARLPALSPCQIQRCAWERRRAAEGDEYYRGVRWTNAKLLRALRQLQKQNGFTSTNLLDQNINTPSANYFVKRFGSLAKARVLANLPDQTCSQITTSAWKRKKEGKVLRRQPGVRPKQWYRSEDILLGLRRLAQREGAVSARLIDEEAGLPSWATIASRFGSLCAAYRLAGLIRLNGSYRGRYGLPSRARTRRT